MPDLREAVYLLCLATSAACAALLIRSYLRSHVRLLLWSSVCFALLALNNLFVFIDLIMLPAIDLLLLRKFASLAAIGVLLFAFIWEAD